MCACLALTALTISFSGMPFLWHSLHATSCSNLIMGWTLDIREQHVALLPRSLAAGARHSLRLEGGGSVGMACYILLAILLPN